MVDALELLGKDALASVCLNTQAYGVAFESVVSGERLDAPFGDQEARLEAGVELPLRGVAHHLIGPAAVDSVGKIHGLCGSPPRATCLVELHHVMAQHPAAAHEAPAFRQAGPHSR